MPRPLHALAIFGLLCPTVVTAKMVVVKASAGIKARYAIGTVLDDDKVIRFAKGEQLTVLARGRTMVLTGPVNGKAKNVEVEYLKRQAARDANMPAVRSGF